MKALIITVLFAMLATLVGLTPIRADHEPIPNNPCEEQGLTEVLTALIPEISHKLYDVPGGHVKVWICGSCSLPVVRAINFRAAEAEPTFGFDAVAIHPTLKFDGHKTYTFDPPSAKGHELEGPANMGGVTEAHFCMATPTETATPTPTDTRTPTVTDTPTPTATPVIVCMEIRGLEGCTLHPTPAPWIPTDVNGDGRVDGFDIGAVVRDFGRVRE